MPNVPADFATLWVKRKATPDEDPYYYNHEGRRFRSYAEIDRFLGGNKTQKGTEPTPGSKKLFDRVKAVAPDTMTARVEAIQDLTTMEAKPRSYRGPRGFKAKAEDGAGGEDSTTGVGTKRKTRAAEEAARGKRARLIPVPGVEATEYELPADGDAVRSAELVAKHGLPAAPKTAFYPPLAGGAGGGSSGGTLKLAQKETPLGTFQYAAVWGSDLRSYMPESLRLYTRTPTLVVRDNMESYLPAYVGAEEAVRAVRAKAGPFLPGIMIAALQLQGATTPVLDHMVSLLAARDRAGFVTTEPDNQEAFLLPNNADSLACIERALATIPAPERRELLERATLVLVVVVRHLGGRTFVNGGLPAGAPASLAPPAPAAAAALAAVAGGDAAVANGGAGKGGEDDDL